MSETAFHAPLPVGSPVHKAGGWFGMKTKVGDYLLAFALPKT